MDAGCEYGGYSSDITRTWPVNGKFTPAQETLYDIVYTVQMELLETVANARDISLDQLFHVMCIRLGKYLQEIGVIDKSLNAMDAAKQAMIKFCPHHVSHYLGMDIHDTPLISRERQLEAGMTFTIEPGKQLLYAKLIIHLPAFAPPGQLSTSDICLSKEEFSRICLRLDNCPINLTSLDILESCTNKSL